MELKISFPSLRIAKRLPLPEDCFNLLTLNRAYGRQFDDDACEEYFFRQKACLDCHHISRPPLPANPAYSKCIWSYLVRITLVTWEVPNNDDVFLPVGMLSTSSELTHYRTQCETHPTDIQGLQVLKNGVNPKSISPGSCLSSWNFSVDPCDYIFTDRFTCGFRCDLIVSGFYRVTEISLDQAGYAGLLPNSSSWNLPHLEVLDMSYNSLSGPIPNSLSNLTRLRRLSLSKNSFTGKIPSSVGSLLRLQELFLDNNKLTGSIPKSFNGLVNLKRLELQQNNISGELPDLNQLRNLILLDLSDNSLAGNFFMTSSLIPLLNSHYETIIYMESFH
ncbi:hypothetical protein HAX54_040047 [Datura stramonium]|uniref:Leucine-rich repeat-containing N-terminal plant-type domain-containing protein n=1 Tax=Datura stramonium TaxID=4076 RepID=A0ABS8SJV8_DATST|nr:hypothetical protein [Datura stramonium]